MDVGLRRINRQMLAKKFSVLSTPCVIEHPSLSCSKVSTKHDVASSRLAVAINGVLNGIVSLVSSKRITGPHLNGKLAFVEGCVHFGHSEKQVTHVVQKWDEITCGVLAVLRKCPGYHFLYAIRYNCQSPVRDAKITLSISSQSSK